jgi:hypothetical protein
MTPLRAAWRLMEIAAAIIVIALLWALLSNL